MSAVQSGVCSVQEITIGRAMAALVLENESLSTTILLDKGADIYRLIYKPKGIDVLAKSPWGLKEPRREVPTTFGSSAAWLKFYAGGWQEIFPSGGGPASYKGVEHIFHGEASLTAWDYQIIETGGNRAEVKLFTRLAHSPFRLERTMRVEAGKPALTLKERITNEGGEDMDYMWGHHPAYGAPFLGAGCRVDIGARSLRGDDNYDGPYNPIAPDSRNSWPMVERGGSQTDMSIVPGQGEPRHILAYFEDFESGWYGITNTELGFGVGLVWPKEIFPYAWYWQEMNATAGFPWYKGFYVMAIEPFSSIPGQGLVKAMEKTGTHRTLKAGDTVEAEITALFYESSSGVERIEADGRVVLK